MHPSQLILAVRFYATRTGHEPVRSWLKALPAQARKVIGEDIKTVQYGWPLGMPLVRKLDAGLWEVRSEIDSGIARVLFTTTEQTMVLVHGFIKKSGKTPKRIIDLARDRAKEVRR